MIVQFISQNFNICIKKGKFSSDLKHVDIVPVHKKKAKKTAGQQAFFLNFCKVH